MTMSMVSRLALVLVVSLLTGPVLAQIEQRCVLMVDRFQDPADLPQFHPVFDQADPRRPAELRYRHQRAGRPERSEFSTGQGPGRHDHRPGHRCGHLAAR